MVSGTLQATILAPMSFVSYVNDIADCVCSKTKLYADDTCYTPSRERCTSLESLPCQRYPCNCDCAKTCIKINSQAERGDMSATKTDVIS